MSSHRRIENLTNGFRLKPQHAERAILNCSAVWVEVGVSIRSLTLAESIAARNVQAAIREPLAYAEIPGLTYEPSIHGLTAHRASYENIMAAHDWAMKAA